MHKLSLDLDALAVESFDTSVAGCDTRGTVEGNALQPIISGALCDMAVSWLLACRAA